MQKLKRSLGAKIAAWVLLAVFLTVLCASGYLVAYLAAKGAYERDCESLTKTALGDLMDQDIMQVVSAIENSALSIDNGRPTSSQLLEMRSTLSYLKNNYPAAESNFWFRVRLTNGGATLISNDVKPDCLAEAQTQYDLVLDYDAEVEMVDFSTLEEMEQYLAPYRDMDIDFEYVTDYDPDTDTYTVTFTHRDTGILPVTIECGVRSALTANDEYRTAVTWTRQLYQMRNWMLVLCAVSLALCAVLLVYLLWSAGHKAGVDTIYLHWANQIPFDLFAAAMFGIALIPWEIYSTSYSYYVVSLFLALLATALVIIATLVSFSARAKAGSWWKNTVVYRLLHWIKRAAHWCKRAIRYALGKLPLIWKALLAWVLFAMLELFLLLLTAGSGYALWIGQFLVVTPALVLVLINLQTLQKGAQQIAEGDLNYQVDTRHMLPDFNHHAQALNSISVGMQKAVEKQMSSERLKAELITNVSHDIKTPLTSIINYIDLLKKPENTPAQTAEYLAVLDRQSARLKKLIEDLIEASKASTGNITPTFEPLDANMLLTQAAGEHSEKLAAQQLELVCSFTPANPTILADGKLLWRVFDNLLDNIRKYALGGTRVYLSSLLVGGKVIITFRNISRDALNINSDELMERFVRGDTSRNTEGSGLGLSIARSLTQLQKGNFELSIDGDLFKVIITFDALNES